MVRTIATTFNYDAQPNDERLQLDSQVDIPTERTIQTRNVILTLHATKSCGFSSPQVFQKYSYPKVIWF